MTDKRKAPWSLKRRKAHSERRMKRAAGRREALGLVKLCIHGEVRGACPECAYLLTIPL